MHELRSAILQGEKLRPDTPVASKQVKRVQQGDRGSLTKIAVKREESRLHDQRLEERHRNVFNSATVYFRRKKHEVTVVNVSSGGVMIESMIEPRIGEVLDIQFADCNRTKCIVRWLREGRIGVEFRQETGIIGSSRIQDFIIRRLRGMEDDEAAEDTHADRTPRHGLIWRGTLHCNHDSVPVRLRNISAEGAMIEADQEFKVGAEVLLDLDEGGTAFGKVRWCEGNQIGLKFDQKFDLKRLARTKPISVAEAPKMVKPKYLESDGSPDSPWAAMWDKFTVNDLKPTSKGNPPTR